MSIQELKLREFARGLRKNQTNAEAIVWEMLRNRRFEGLKFRRQHVIKGYVVDFYCSKYKLAIEIDGDIYDKQREYDLYRDDQIAFKGIKVIRITNDEIISNKEIVFKKIKDSLPLSRS